MPVHSHHGAKRLKPEWVREPAQELVASIMMYDRFGDDCAETCHASPKPMWYAAAVKREIGASSPTSHFACLRIVRKVME